MRAPMRRLVLVLATAVRGEGVDYTDMQKWAGLLAQSFLSHSDDASHAHSQLASFKELVNTKARARSAPRATGCDLDRALGRLIAARLSRLRQLRSAHLQYTLSARSSQATAYDVTQVH